MKVVTSEFMQLIKEHKLLVAIIAVIAVPILYAGMFLWAFWDPYDHLEDVPVAIVNEDSGYDYEGERLEIGNELVDNLKEEADFDFHFVDKATGMKGLENQDYYILIEIPNYFSEHATTVMDDQPKQTDLIYTPNESFNFLAAQIGETAMLQIEMAVEEKITETYAETIFEQIDEVAVGLVDASDATEDLEEGAIELKDGSQELKDNLQTLASKTIEFKDGVNTATKGTNDLVTGATSLATGIAELYDNSNKLRDASADLNSGASQLSQGISDANKGINEIDTKIPELMDGTKQVQDGLGQFNQQLPKQMSKKLQQQIGAGTETILAGTDELRNGIVDGLEKKLAPELSQGLTDGLSTGLAKGVVSEANKLIGEAPTSVSKAVAKDITDYIRENEVDKKNDLVDILKNADVSDEVLQEVSNKLDELSPNYTNIEQFIQNQLQQVLDESLKDVAITEQQQKQLENIIREQIKTGIDDGVSDGVNQTVASVNAGFDEYEAGITTGLADATSGLEDQIEQALKNPITQLQDGLTQIGAGQEKLSGGVAQLSDGAGALQDGSSALVTGQESYLSNMNAFTSSFSKANQGASELSNGTHTLADGMFKLQDGSVQLNEGSEKLSDGSGKLNDGMGTLLEGTEEFNVEMQEAAAEAGDVNATDATHKMIADPVNVKNEKINEVPNYGTGFAPYFLSLGLFVGALLLSIVFPLREPASRPTSGVNWFIGKLAVLVSVGILQAIIASGVLLLVLGLEVKSVPLFMLFAILTSLVFISLIQFFVTCLGDPGRFIAIILLIMQLTTSAGTFPLELIPKFLQPFSHVLPMTYSVQGFKEVISSGNYGAMWQNAGILSIFMLVFMGLSLSYFIVMYKRKFQGLPEEA